MSTINWFEIPVENMGRAVRFYEALLGETLEQREFLGVPHALFADSQSNGRPIGALIAEDGLLPSPAGTRIYLHANDIDTCLARAVEAGGGIALPKTSIGPQGSMALVRDSEGNLVGLHTPGTV